MRDVITEVAIVVLVGLVGAIVLLITLDAVIRIVLMADDVKEWLRERKKGVDKKE